MAANRETHVVVSIRVPPVQRAAMERIAEREGIAVSEILRTMIRRVVAEGSTGFLFGRAEAPAVPAE